jgi:hypothetical protein
MEYKVFEDEKTIKTVKKPEDIEDFEYYKKKLGFIKEKDIDLITFCAAIALRKEFEGEEIKKRTLPGKKLATMVTFDKAKFYDLIVLE